MVRPCLFLQLYLRRHGRNVHFFRSRKYFLFFSFPVLVCELHWDTMKAYLYVDLGGVCLTRPSCFVLYSNGEGMLFLDENWCDFLQRCVDIAKVLFEALSIRSARTSFP